LVFSFDWNNVQSNNIRLQRQSDGTLEPLDTGLFNETGHYYFCWKPPYINYDGYVIASDSFWKVIGVPTIKNINFSSSFVFNQKLEFFILTEQAPQGSQFYLFEDSTDWDLSNQLNELEISADRNILSIWFPESRYNFSYKLFSLLMHICWRRMTLSGYSSWQRIQHSDGSALSITLTNLTADRRLLPKITSFSHPYASAISPDEEIWFQIDTDGIPMMYL